MVNVVVQTHEDVLRMAQAADMRQMNLSTLGPEQTQRVELALKSFHGAPRQDG